MSDLQRFRTCSLISHMSGSVYVYTTCLFEIIWIVIEYTHDNLKCKDINKHSNCPDNTTLKKIDAADFLDFVKNIIIQISLVFGKF